MSRDNLHARQWGPGISRVWLIVLVVVLVAIVGLGTWVANTFFWFGTHPPREDYAAKLREFAAAEAEGIEATWTAYREAAALL